MQHELELNAWVWNAPRSAHEMRRVTELAEAIGFRSESITADAGSAYVVRIIAVESSNGIAATTVPRTTVSLNDAEVPLEPSAFYENIAVAVGRTMARTDARPSSPTTSIQIDSSQFVVRAPSSSTALDAVLGRLGARHRDLRTTAPELIAV